MTSIRRPLSPKQIEQRKKNKADGNKVDFSKGTTKSRILEKLIAEAIKKEGGRGGLRVKTLYKQLQAEIKKNPSRFTPVQIRSFAGNYAPRTRPVSKPQVKPKGKSGKDVDFSKGTTKSRILAAQLAKAKAAKKAGTTPESRGVKGSTLRERMLAKKIAAEKAKNPSRFKDSPVKATAIKPKVKPKANKTTTQTGNVIPKGGKLKMLTSNLGITGVKPKPRTGIRPKIVKEKRQEVTKPKTGFNVTRPRPETTNPIRPRVSVGSKATKPDVKERPRRSVRRGSRLAEIRKRMLERTTTTSPRRRSRSNRSQAPNRSNTSQRSSMSRFRGRR